MEKHNEDFGQTFGRWGAPTGPYLVLPFLGSSTCATASAGASTSTTDPLSEIRPFEAAQGLVGLRLIKRAPTCSTRAASWRRRRSTSYVFQRDAYLQRRRSLVYDGHPPREKIREDSATSQEAGRRRKGHPDDQDQKPR